MSRGLGKVQQAIMDAVDRDGYVVLRDVEGFSQPSISRAAKTLAERGHVDVWYRWLRTECLYPRGWRWWFENTSNPNSDWLPYSERKRDGTHAKQESRRRCAFVVKAGTPEEQVQKMRVR